MRARPAVLLGIVVATLLGFSGYAAATLTDNKGFSFTMLSKAIIANGVDIQTNGATDLYTVRVKIEPGGTSGWHHHPDAMAVAAVTQGTMTLRMAHGDGCESKVMPAGVASVEPVGGVHEARNEGAVPVEFYFTFFGKAGTPILMEQRAQRLAVPSPRHGPRPYSARHRPTITRQVMPRRTSCSLARLSRSDRAALDVLGRAQGNRPGGYAMSITEQTETRIVRAACHHDCPDTCAMLVTVEGGVATKVRGDPDHPFTQGGLCVKMNDYTTHVYDPNRVLYPLRRVGPKGEGRFERVTWDDALDEIAERFTAIIDEYGSQAILPYSYLGTEGILNGLTVGDPFFHRLGASVSERTFCDSGSCTAYIMTIGATAGMDPESFAHSNYIILWACNLRSTNLHMWPFIKAAQDRGAKVVVIDPLRHRTAQSANWYIPIRPGTDGALALAMMHVIINEGLVDKEYVDSHTLGFEQLAERVQEYPPERAAQITGVPAEDIVTLAREYAMSQPSAIRIGVAIERHAVGGQTVRAITCLPALVGAWRRPGGGILQLPLWAFPMKWDVLQRPELIRPGTRVVNQFQLGPALTGDLGLDPPVQALFVYNSNPVVVAPGQGQTVAGLAREDLFTVVSEQYLTDTADYADIVLPATTQLEQFDLMFSWGHFYITHNEPAVEPLGETVPNVELFRRLSERLGLEDDWYRLSGQEMALAALDWSAPAMSGITLESLRETGWARLNLPAADAFAPHAEGNFLTASGKCEFVSSIPVNFVAPVFREGSNEHQPMTPIDVLPHYTPAEEDREGYPYPLHFLSPKAHAFLNSQYGNIAYQRRIQGEQWLTIHADDAEARGIEEGQAVRVFNAAGEFQAVARISGDDQAARGVVVCPGGHWRKLTAGGNTVNTLTRTAFADMGNAPSFSDTRVEVAPLAAT